MKQSFRLFGIFFISLLSILGLLSLQSCKKKEEKPPIEYNAVVEDPIFKDNLAGFKIFLLAPGSGTDPEKIQKIIETPGLSIEVPENTFSDSIIFHANSDKARYENLKNLLEQGNHDNSLLWALRGGYGSARLIESLKTLSKPASEKIFIGYSDMTVLHLFFSQKWGWKTIHGAMLIDLLNTKKDPNNFLKLSKLLADIKNPNIKTIKAEIHLEPWNNQAKHLQEQSKIQGNLTGGNLAMVQTSIGTDWQMDTQNKIVFLEDDGERGYQIDRMLNHFKQVGLFKNVKAVVLGDFIGSDDYNDLALKRFADEADFPVFKTDEIGHGVKNYPLIYNSDAKITPSTNPGFFDLVMEIKK